ncbi:hypothetical protein V2J09_002714 [Rumex salicifolius]
MSNPSDFNRVLIDLLTSLVSKTAAGNSTVKFAMAKANVNTSQTIYGFTQCTPDLSQSKCNTCLWLAMSDLPNCCLPYQELRYFRPSCNIHYSINNFWGVYDALALKGENNDQDCGCCCCYDICMLITRVIVYLFFKQDRRKWKSADNVNMKIVLSLLLIFFQGATLSSAQPEFVNYQCDNTYGNYTSNSTYQQNLNSLLSDISSNTSITYGFYNFSYGKDPDIVNGIALCRGDVLLDECHSCLKNATAKLFGLCTNQKQAIGWYDRCMVRYSNRTIFGVMEYDPYYWIRYRFKALDQKDFNHTVTSLFGSLVDKAVRGNSTLKFAMNQAIVSAFVTVYAYTQCTLDLSQSDCYACLSDSITELPVFLPYRGARFFRASCNIRYEVYKYSDAFDSLANSSEAPSPLPSTTSSPSIPSKRISRSYVRFGLVGKGSTTSKIVAIVAVVAVTNKRGRKMTNNELEEEDEISSIETLQISYADVKDATQGFAEANELGRGGFGIVYKVKHHF